MTKEDPTHKAGLDQIAQEKFGKSYDECDTHERVQVGGTKGGKAQGGHSAQPELAPPAPEVKFGEDNPAPGGAGAGKATKE